MSRVSRNIIYNGLGQGLSVLLSLVAVRLVFRRLGGDALGLIYFSLAVSAALSVVLQLGICESAVREVASHHAERPEYIGKFIRTSSLFYWAAYLALAAISFALAPYLVQHWVRLDSLDPATAVKIMRILTLGALVTLPGGLYRALLVGLQHMGLTNLIDVSAKGLQQGGIFLILLMHGGLFQVAYWIVASTLVPVAVYWVVCTRYFSLRALLIPGFSTDVVKQNVGYASSLMIITLCGWLLTQADRVIISKLLPLALLGIYTFARGAINQGTLLTGSINNAIFPHFSALHAEGKAHQMKSAYNKIQDLICIGTIPLFAVVPFAAIPLFSRVFDMQSAHMLLLPVTILSIGYYMNGTLTTPYVVSLAVGRPDITARQNVAALFVVLPTSAMAIYYFGLSGASFSWVVYHLFAYSYGLPRICRECLAMRVRIWYWHVFRILGSAMLIYGTAWIAVVTSGAVSLIPLALAYAVATLVYSLAAFWIMGVELRSRIIDFLKPLRPKDREFMVPE